MYLNRFSFIAFLTCSVFSFSHISFALKEGEVEEVDLAWATVKSKFDKEFNEIQNGVTILPFIEGTPSQKQELIPTFSFVNHLNTIGREIQQYQEMDYEPIQPVLLKLKESAKAIMKWASVSSNSTDKTRRDFVEKFFPLLKDLWASSKVAKDETKVWHSLRDAFLHSYEKDKSAASDILSTLQSLSYDSPDAQKWLETSIEVLSFTLAQSLDLKEEVNAFDSVKKVNIKITPELKQKFLPIKNKIIELTKTAQDKDVHSVLDAFYKQNAGTVTAVADELFSGNGSLPLSEIKLKFKALLKDNPDWLKSYKYFDQGVTLEQMSQYIDKVYQSDMDPKLCSHTFNLASQLMQSKAYHSDYARDCLFNSIVENYLTKGGCLDGRRDRQFRDLAFMLIALGL